MMVQCPSCMLQETGFSAPAVKYLSICYVSISFKFSLLLSLQGRIGLRLSLHLNVAPGSSLVNVKVAEFPSTTTPLLHSYTWQNLFPMIIIHLLTHTTAWSLTVFGFKGEIFLNCFSSGCGSCYCYHVCFSPQVWVSYHSFICIVFYSYVALFSDTNVC